MKKFFICINFLLLVCWATPVYAQAQRQVYSRTRDATLAANVARVTQLTVSFPATYMGLSTRSGNYFYDTDGSAWRWWLGDAIDSDDIASTTKMPYVGNFNHIWDVVNDNWDRMSGVEITLSMKDVFALLTYSANMFLVGDTWNDWTGSQMDEETIAETGYSPWVQNFNYGYDEDNTVWRRFNMTADGFLRVDIASQTTPATLAAAGPTATDNTADLILSSQDISEHECWGVHLTNNGGGSGSALSDADVQVSRDGGTTWESLTWTGCDTLAAAANCDYDFPSNSFTNVRVYTTAAVDTTVTVKFSARK